MAALGGTLDVGVASAIGRVGPGADFRITLSNVTLDDAVDAVASNTARYSVTSCRHPRGCKTTGTWGMQGFVSKSVVVAWLVGAVLAAISVAPAEDIIDATGVHKQARNNMLYGSLFIIVSTLIGRSFGKEPIVDKYLISAWLILIIVGVATYEPIISYMYVPRVSYDREWYFVFYGMLLMIIAYLAANGVKRKYSN